MTAVAATVTEKLVTVFPDGKKLISWYATTTGDGSKTPITITFKEVNKIFDYPTFEIVKDDQTTKATVTLTAMSGLTLTITPSAAVENTKVLDFRGLYVGW